MGVSGQRHAPAALLPPGKGPPVPIVQEAGLAPEAVWTQATGKILCPCRGSNLDRPVVQPVVRHYTDWATLAPYIYIYIHTYIYSCKYGKNDPLNSQSCNREIVAQKVVIKNAERLDLVVNTPASYWGGSPVQISQRQGILTCFSRFSSVSPGECRDSTLKLGHYRFLPNPF
jgi:hypothetical protein